MTRTRFLEAHVRVAEPAQAKRPYNDMFARRVAQCCVYVLGCLMHDDTTCSVVCPTARLPVSADADMIQTRWPYLEISASPGFQHYGAGLSLYRVHRRSIEHPAPTTQEVCPLPHPDQPTHARPRHDKSDLVASADSLTADPMAHEKLPRGKERLVHSVIHHYQPKGPRKDPVVRRRYQTVLSSALSAAP